MSQFSIDIDLCKTFKISPTELFFLRALLIYQDEDDYKPLQELTSCNISVKQIIQNLQQKKIVNKWEIPEGNYNPLEIPINKTIVKQFYKSSFELGKELYDYYPPYGEINGSWVQLRTISKKFDSLEDAFRRYGKEISYNPEMHQKVIEITKWAAEKGILCCSLASYICDLRWNDLMLLRDGKGKQNTNFDNFKIL